MALDLTHGPITERFREAMNRTAAALSRAFPGAGFVLLTFDEDTSGGRVNYISNRDRETMITAMKELLARFEGRVAPTPKGKQ